ncbi:MAG: 16S rRNA (cytosine(967)-C(5))-methyltransferase RsmB, partial [Nitrospirae bacterium]
MILKAVLADGHPLRPLLMSAYKEADDRNRRFLKELISGVFRRRLYLEWILRGYLKKPSRIKPLTWFNLLTALYQIEFLHTPDYAVVNEAVEVEKCLGRNTSLVNGLLRNYLRSGSKPPLPEDEIKRMSILESHPEWLIKRWIDRFGPEMTRTLLRANNQEPPLTLRVNSLKTTREEMRKNLSAEGVECEYTKYSPLGLRIIHYSSFSQISRHVGNIYIQDEAAQLVTFLLRPERGQRILDACAAPGGKTLQ